MATVEEVIIQVRAEGASKSIADLREELGRARKELDRLPRSSEEFTRQAAKVAVIQGNFQRANESVKLLGNSINAASDTIEGLKNKQKALNVEIARTPFGTQAYKDLAKQLVVVNETLSEQQRALKGTASFYQQVKGATTEAIQSAGGFSPIIDTLVNGIGKLKGFSESLQSVAAAFNGLGESVEKSAADFKAFGETATQGATDVKDFDQAATATAGGAKGLRGILQSVGAAFTGLRGAILASGIGALVIILGSLITFFTQTKKGVELLAAATAGFKATISVLTNAVAQLGEFLFLAFTKPQEAIQQLIELVKKDLAIRLEGLKSTLEGIIDLDLGKIGEGLRKGFTGVVGQAIVDTANALSDAARAGFALEQAQQRLNDRTREFNVLNAQQLGQGEQLRALSADASQGIQERIDALQRAGLAETEALRRQITLAREQERIIRAQNALRGDLISAEDLDKQSEATVRRIELENQLLIKQQALKSEIANLERDQRIKAVEQIKVESEQRIAANDAELANAETSFERRQQLLTENVRLQTELAALAAARLGQSEEEQKLLAELQGQALTRANTVAATRVQISKDEQARITQLNQEGEDARIRAENEGVAESIALKMVEIRRFSELLQMQVSDVTKSVAERVAIQEAGNAKLAELEGQLAELRVKLADETAKAQTAALSSVTANVNQSIDDSFEALSTIGELATQFSDQQAEAAQANIDLIQQTVSASEDAIKSLEDEIKGATGVRRGELQKQLAAEKEAQVANLAALESAERKKQDILRASAVATKAIQITGAIINTAQAIVAALAPPPIGLGPVFGPIIAGVAAATGAAQIATIAAQQFAAGGITPAGGISQGPRHAQGGIALVSGGAKVGEIEGGEAILTRGVVSNPSLLAAASQINVAGGGRPLTPSGRFALGGITPTADFSATPPGMTMADIIRAIQALPPPVVSVEDINREQRRTQVVDNLRSIRR